MTSDVVLSLERVFAFVAKTIVQLLFLLVVVVTDEAMAVKHTIQQLELMLVTVVIVIKERIPLLELLVQALVRREVVFALTREGLGLQHKRSALQPDQLLLFF